jgi:hypothetical protein
MQFEKGQSGNPAGRRPGSKNRATLMAQALLEGEAEELLRAGRPIAPPRKVKRHRFRIARAALLLRPRGRAHRARRR